MSLAVTLALVLLAGAYVALPFFQTGDETEGGIALSAAEIEQARLERSKVEAYTAIRDAEFDFHTGKLSDEDFNGLRGKYEAQALRAIAGLEKARGSQQPAVTSKVHMNFCPGCGTKRDQGAKFCGGCGVKFA